MDRLPRDLLLVLWSYFDENGCDHVAFCGVCKAWRRKGMFMPWADLIRKNEYVFMCFVSCLGSYIVFI